LAARLEPEPVAAAFFEQRLDDVAVLVDLDRVDGAVLAAVAVLLARFRERFGELAHTRAQQPVESQQDGRLHAAAADLSDELEHVDPRGVLAALGGHLHLTFGVDGEVAQAPVRDVVEGFTVDVGPLAHAGTPWFWGRAV